MMPMLVGFLLISVIINMAQWQYICTILPDLEFYKEVSNSIILEDNNEKTNNSNP